MRYLGIDFGLRKLGLALGDDETRLATPAEVIQNDDRLLVRLAELVRDEGIESVVVGVPLPTGDHHSGEQLQKTRAFIEDLKRVVNVPVHEVDEKYTSSESRRMQKEMGSGVPEDALAAMLILQSYLDELVDV
jgi:putative Holliday junction resolvase